ncbi:MAG: hypothetical protein IJY99_03850 [Alphaproteobacteria bacterium]|nr:hypothetical protein [Alphaproteobacteria bacterium]
MIVKPIYVFEANAYNIVRREFPDSKSLYKFIKSFDFTKIYDENGNPIDNNYSCETKRFRLGHRLSFAIDGYNVKSDVVWGPEFYVGRSASVLPQPGGRPALEIDSPKAATVFDNACYQKLLKYNYSSLDKVFDTKTMRQVYPSARVRESDFVRFIRAVSAKKYKIEKIK